MRKPASAGFFISFEFGAIAKGLIPSRPQPLDQTPPISLPKLALEIPGAPAILQRAVGGLS
ncbi:hypothetical protein [Usitatibacter palustris]|uniref:hypothetical protein n=1 Tax=Usitatibacter palustris TaxID=2732487 RepID=UPI00148923F6|nr:hypothetical protein [Usitatibacter palustris]